jgi:hypothetical protein
VCVTATTNIQSSYTIAISIAVYATIIIGEWSTTTSVS